MTAASLPPVVAVVGPSGSGKTSLVERLVEALAAEGRRVATVKSIHHAIEPDDPATDTHRHRTAGAAATAGITPRHAFEIRRHDPGGSSLTPDARKRAALRETLDRFESAGYDLAIVEGFAEVAVPTVRLGDKGGGDETDGGGDETDGGSDETDGGGDETDGGGDETDGRGDAVAGETIADGDDSFDEVLAAVRAVDSSVSLGRPDAAEPNADDTRNT